MKIWMIWARAEGATWLEAAWDDETRGEAFEEWDMELANAFEEYGNDNVRVVGTQINMSDIEDMFAPRMIASHGALKENA